MADAKFDKDDVANALLQAIEKGLTENKEADITSIVETFFDENEATIEKAGAQKHELLGKVAEKYPARNEIRKFSRHENKAYIHSLDEYTRRKKAPDRNKGYVCNVFMQNNNRKKETRPLTIPRGTLSYIGAMTHRGKTTALISIAIDAVRQNYELKANGKNFSKVVFITTEETPEQIFDRMIKAILYKEQFEDYNPQIFNPNGDLKGDIDELDEKLNFYMEQYEQRELGIEARPSNLQSGIYSSFEKLKEYMSEETFAVIDHTRQRTFEELTATINALDNGSILLLDYIQHCKSPAENGVNNRQVIIQGQSQTLSDIAGQKDLVIISGGQFSRKGNEKSREEDKFKADFLDLTLFRESGDIEQDAYLVIGIGQQSINSDTDAETPPRRFYEILKQRYHAQDTHKYLIADKSIFSLYSCAREQTDKGNWILKYFTEYKQDTSSKTRNKASNKEAMMNFANQYNRG